MNKQTIIENSKVLVTGGAGFIGSNIIEALLKQNNKVVCLDNFSTGKRKNIESFLANDNFQMIEGDIRKFDDCTKAVKKVDYVLHQAAIGSVQRSIKDPQTTNSVNIDGFLNMLIATKNEGIKRFVYASSSSIYGDHKDLPKIEERIGTPLSPYAITKYVNELYAKVFSDLYQIETIGLRYFNVFGKRQDPEGEYAAVIPKFISLLLKNKSPVIYGDGNQSRDFTYIDNVISINQLAALTQNKNAINTVYNVAYGENITINALTATLKEVLSRFDKKILNIKPEYKTERPGDIKHSLASIDKGKKLLGYNPRYSLKKGLGLAIGWYWGEMGIVNL